MKITRLFGIAAGLAMVCGAMAAEGDPVFHLSFDDIKPGAESCADRMNPDRVCSLNNPKRFSSADGKSGQALALDNAKEKTAPKDNPNAGITVPRFWDGDFAKALSVEVWIKIDKDVEYKRSLMYILQCGGQYGPGFSLYYNCQEIHFISGAVGSTGKNGMVVVKTKVADIRDQWVHVAVTYDGEKKTAKLYINGECVGENTDFVITPPKNKKQQLVIGRFFNMRGWCGCLDELKIYKRVLTPEEILEHAKLEL